MDRAQTFIDSVLQHAETKYYDPAKAREYYLRTRELKGRQRGALKTESKRQAWDYSKAAIEESKDKDLEVLSEGKRQVIEKARANAEKRRDEIREKLSELLTRLTEKTANDVAQKIASLPPIPKGISKEKRSELAAERREEILKIRGEAASDKDSARNSASSDRERVRAELKETIEVARSAYESLKESLIEKYEVESQQEYEAIAENV